jgi:hypothetical protein
MSDLPMGPYPRVGYNVSWFQTGTIRAVSSAVMLNVIVFFVDSFVIKGSRISPKEADKVERAAGNVSAII